MTDKILDQATQAVTGNFSIQTNTKSGKMVTVQGYLYYEESIESINGRIDQIQAVLDRQLLKDEIACMRKVRAHALQEAQDAEAHARGLKAKKDVGGKLATAEQKALENTMTTVAASMKRLEDLDAKLVEAEEQLATA